MIVVVNILIYIFEALISLFYFGNKFEKKINKWLILLVFALSAVTQFAISLLGIPLCNILSFIIFNFLICRICCYFSGNDADYRIDYCVCFKIRFRNRSIRAYDKCFDFYDSKYLLEAIIFLSSISFVETINFRKPQRHDKDKIVIALAVTCFFDCCFALYSTFG